MWDLERENCIAQLNLPAAGAAGGGGSEPGGAAPAVEHIAASCHSPLLYAADNSGTGARRWRGLGLGGGGSCAGDVESRVWEGCLFVWEGCLFVGAGPATPSRLNYSLPPACLPSCAAVRIFDLRSSEVVGSVQHLRTRLAGGRGAGQPQGGHAPPRGRLLCRSVLCTPLRAC